MRIFFDNKQATRPSLSIVLLDWSCRESFHALGYLNDQTVPRDEYEVLWVEFYAKRAAGIDESLAESERRGAHPVLDKWISLGIDPDVYYHKHLMYNVGILAAKGEIIVFCDSDAIFAPTFVESIMASFAKNPSIVLHLDEVRNNDTKFYPFSHPSIPEITGTGCINWRDGKTAGLADTDDPIHTRNYGACMCARRDDLIAIGGADEHIDYLGHICGPYEMTFRLVNNGAKEVWHETEFLYHVWHPGADGRRNYLGPHDGYNMSTTALAVRRTRRTLPLVENTAVKTLRMSEDDIIYAPLLPQAIPERMIERWKAENLGRPEEPILKLKRFMRHPVTNFSLTVTLLKMLGKQFRMKATKFSRQPKSSKDVLKKVLNTYRFIKNMSGYNAFVLQRCGMCLRRLGSENVREVAVFGTDEIAELLYKLSLEDSVKVSAVYGYIGGGRFHGFNVLPIEEVRDYAGRVVVASFAGADEQIGMLKDAGVVADRIVPL